MSEHVVIPKADWIDILDGVREKTGKTDALVSGQVRAEIESISVGSEGNTLNEYLKGDKTEITADDMLHVGSIRKYQFYYSPITSIEIPDSVTSIGEWAFGYCTKLTSVVIPDTVTTVGNNLFERSSVKSVMFGNGITELPGGQFKYCAVEHVILGENITSLGGEMFVNSSLKTITIPAKVTKMDGARTFWNCPLEECICLPETPPTIRADTFTNSTTNCTFRVPAGSVEAYKTAPNWIAYADHIVPIEE